MSRDLKGRYAKKRGRLVWGIVLLAIIVFGVGAKYIEPFLDKEIEAIAAPRVEAAEIEVDRLDVKVDELKKEVLDTLEKCESAGHKAEDGIITFDTNNQPSIGQFQFQRDTVIYYHQKMTGETITRQEAVQIAIDDERARELASYIIFETNSGVAKDWVICSRNYGLQSKVDVIKSLTQ